jgi:hypothetical protein
MVGLNECAHLSSMMKFFCRFQNYQKSDFYYLPGFQGQNFDFQKNCKRPKKFKFSQLSESVSDFDVASKLVEIIFETQPHFENGHFPENFGKF